MLDVNHNSVGSVGEHYMPSEALFPNDSVAFAGEQRSGAVEHAVVTPSSDTLEDGAVVDAVEAGVGAHNIIIAHVGCERK